MAENIEEKLDSPLVVHKEDDASYQENANDISMNYTHTDEESSDVPTLERHRFRKKKKKSKAPLFIVALLVVCVSVVCALFYTGTIQFGEPEETTTTKKSYTTQAKNDFEGVITLKGTYIFFEGTELDDIQSLEREIKYLKKGTKFTIQLENADNDFLNDTLLLMLSKYGIEYEITHVVSSGLMSKFETTTTTTTTTTKKATSTTKKPTPDAKD